MKYIVRKEHVNSDGLLCEVGYIDTYHTDTCHVDGLLKHGFIEPYEGRSVEVVGGRFTDLNFNDRTRFRCYANYDMLAEVEVAITEALKLFFEWLHTPLEVAALKESTHWADMYDAMNKARELVLADNEASDE